jgi:hypothetical protein
MHAEPGWNAPLPGNDGITEWPLDTVTGVSVFVIAAGDTNGMAIRRFMPIIITNDPAQNWSINVTKGERAVWYRQHARAAVAFSSVQEGHWSIATPWSWVKRSRPYPPP